MDLIQKIKIRLKEIKNIKFKQHFHDKAKERPVSEELIAKHLKNPDALIEVQEQEDNAVYRLRFSISHRYDLVIVTRFLAEDLYIITAWNTSRKWQRKVQK